MSKAFKWNDEKAKFVVDMYNENGKDNGTIDAIAVAVAGQYPVEGENVPTSRQIIGKLVSEKVYVKVEKPKAQPKDDGPSKSDLLSRLDELQVATEGADGATKGFLSAVIAAVETRQDEASAE